MLSQSPVNEGRKTHFLTGKEKASVAALLMQTIRAVISACEVVIITAWGAINLSRMSETRWDEERHSSSLCPTDVGVPPLLGTSLFALHQGSTGHYRHLGLDGFCGAALYIVGCLEHPRPLPTRCQLHPPVMTIKVSPDIVEYPLRSKIAPI